MTSTDYEQDREWETGRNLGTTFTRDDEDYCSGCDEYVFDDAGTGECDVCGTRLKGAS